MSIYAVLAVSALADGIFSGYYLRTGIDASPSAIGVLIINQLESLLPSQVIPQAEFYKFLIVAIPWIVTVVTIFLAPSKKLAVIIFVAVFGATALFVGYYNT